MEHGPAGAGLGLGYRIQIRDSLYMCESQVSINYSHFSVLTEKHFIKLNLA